MTRLLIVADDLSGAADCAVACAAAGLDALVALGGGAGEADVLAVDADSRRLDAAAAARATLAAFRAHDTGGAILFKKLDSGLRGNVGAEIRAGLDHARARNRGAPALASAFAIMAPAFPATGRTTRGGHQHIGGVPVERTELWRREGIDGTAHVPGMLARAGLRTVHLGLGLVRDPPALRAALTAASGRDDAVVCDAESEADLAAIAAAGIALGPDTLWAGSAGLARHLPSAAGIAGRRPARTVAPAAGPILFIVGSLSRVSREQAAALAESGAAPIAVDPATLRGGPGPPAWAEKGDRLGRFLAAGQDAVVTIEAGAQVDVGEGLALCAALARLVAPHVGSCAALVATGGETARAVLLAIGVTGLRLVCEVEPGVPLSLAEGAARALPVITKAGGFGRRETLANCRAALRAGWRG
ncbi:MAG: four-carbon acid sugar kinase family protein [Acidiphilium sp.]